MTDNDGTFIQNPFYGRGMIRGIKSFQNFGAGSYGMIFITDHIFDTDNNSMKTAGFFSFLSLTVKPIRSFQRLFFI